MSNAKKVLPRKAWGIESRNGWLHINTTINKKRIRQATGYRDEELDQAIIHRDKLINDVRQALLFGIRPSRTFGEGCLAYLQECASLKSFRGIKRYVRVLRKIIPDTFPMSEINNNHAKAIIAELQGKSNRTINGYLGTLVGILKCATRKIDEHNLTWLGHVPYIEMLPKKIIKPVYHLSWEDEPIFFAAMPEYLADLAKFVLYTGCRDQEACQLSWKWEKQVILQDIYGNSRKLSIFVIPPEAHKTGANKMGYKGHYRIVYLNDVAQSLVEKNRGKHEEYVFINPETGFRTSRLTNRAWNGVATKTGILTRPHHLRHTFATRLDAAGIDEKTIELLMSHTTKSVTRHYSEPAIWRLYVAVNSITEPPKIVTNLTLSQITEAPRLLITH